MAIAKPNGNIIELENYRSGTTSMHESNDARSNTGFTAFAEGSDKVGTKGIALSEAASVFGVNEALLKEIDKIELVGPVYYESLLSTAQTYLKQGKSKHTFGADSSHGNVYSTKETPSVSTQKEHKAMDWQEKYFDKMEHDFSDMKTSLQATEERIAGIVNQAMSEMRDRDNQRHKEFIEIRSDLSKTKNWTAGTAMALIVGIASIVIAAIVAITTMMPK